MAMIALAWQLNPRVHEIAGLTKKDITLAEDMPPGTLSVLLGKAISGVRLHLSWQAMPLPISRID